MLKSSIDKNKWFMQCLHCTLIHWFSSESGSLNDDHMRHFVLACALGRLLIWSVWCFDCQCLYSMVHKLDPLSYPKTNELKWKSLFLSVDAPSRQALIYTLQIFVKLVNYHLSPWESGWFVSNASFCWVMYDKGSGDLNRQDDAQWDVSGSYYKVEEDCFWLYKTHLFYTLRKLIKDDTNICIVILLTKSSLLFIFVVTLRCSLSKLFKWPIFKAFWAVQCATFSRPDLLQLNRHVMDASTRQL